MCNSDDKDYTDKDNAAARDEKNQTPEALSKGIVMERKCTDVLICLIFSVFFCGMFATAAYGYAKGDPAKLIMPFDSDGNSCGGAGPAKDYRYLFWPDLAESVVDNANNNSISLNMFGNTVCVSSCPSNFTVSECYPNQYYTSCPTAFIDNSAYLSRFCLPNSDSLKSALLGKIADGDLGKYMGDLATTWWVFLVVGVISAVLGFAYLVMLRWFAKPLIYLSFVVILGLLVGGGFYVFFLAGNYDKDDHTYQVMHGMGILLWIIAGIFLFVLCCCWSRIQLGAAIVMSASDFVATVPCILLIPLVFFIIVGCWVVFWVISAVFVYSVGDATKSSTQPILAEMHWNNVTRYVWIYHLFGLFWVSAFIIGCAQFIVAASCALWYFASGGAADDRSQGAVSLGVRWLFRNHVGSIAFGSLIIAIMQMIKVLFEYMRRKYEKLVGNNAVLKCIICCLGCCVACVDRCVKHITKNAYIQMALTSSNFCVSAWLTFWLIVRNCARFGTVSGIGWILMFVGKATICTLSGWIAYLIIMNASVLKDQVYSPAFPVVIVVLIAYLVSSVFLSVFSFSSTTILHCFILDSEIAEKTGRSGAHTPESLIPFIELNDAKNARQNP